MQSMGLDIKIPEIEKNEIVHPSLGLKSLQIYAEMHVGKLTAKAAIFQITNHKLV